MDRAAVTITSAAAAALLLLAAPAGAQSRCVAVEGRHTERDARGAGCTSPVGLCIVAEYHGDLTGTLTGQATSIGPTADTAGRSVLLFTTTSRFLGRVTGRQGSLETPHAGAFRGAGAGSIVDLQTVVGAGGDPAGSTGEIRASGTYSPATGGRSDYRGTMCRG